MKKFIVGTFVIGLMFGSVLSAQAAVGALLGAKAIVGEKKEAKPVPTKTVKKKKSAKASETVKEEKAEVKAEVTPVAKKVIRHKRANSTRKLGAEPVKTVVPVKPAK